MILIAPSKPLRYLGISAPLFTLGAAILLAPGVLAEETPPTTASRVLPSTWAAINGASPPQTIVAPSGKELVLRFNDEFDVVIDAKKDGKPYIHRSKWQTTFWQGPRKAWEVDETTMPWKMHCDYVRVYQSADGAPPDAAAPVDARPASAPPKAPADRPTPYPDQKAGDDAVWPGKGPIRVFGWMVDNRAAFWKEREKARGAVVFAGDSLIGGWKGLAEAFPNLKVANRGIGGDVSRGLLFRFKEDVLDLQPRAIVICTGSNDLSTHADPVVVEHNLGLMIAQARAHDPKLPIVLCLVPPRDVADAPIKPGALADLNARIAKLGAGQEHLVVLDIFTPLATAEGKPKLELFSKDRIHPAPPAYKIWAELLQPALKGLGVGERE